MIKFENVGVVYPGGVKALDNINLEINEGDFVIIVGLSGAGKSTLLRSINNLVKPTDGDVFVDGKNGYDKSKIEDLKMIYHKLRSVRSLILDGEFRFNNYRNLIDEVFYTNDAKRACERLKERRKNNMMEVERFEKEDYKKLENIERYIKSILT